MTGSAVRQDILQKGSNRMIVNTGREMQRREGVQESLCERVGEIMRREWRCVFDLALLEGMLYESMLGRARSCLLSLRECRARHRELGLPATVDIAAAAREAVSSWGKS